MLQLLKQALSTIKISFSILGHSSLKLFDANMAPQQKMLTPMYVVGRPLDDANEWIKECRLQTEADSMPKVLVGSTVLISTGSILGKGTYGKVYEYSGLDKFRQRKRCAVKILRPSDCEEPITMFELGHCEFVDAEERTRSMPVVYTAVFDGIQVMELGSGNSHEIVDINSLRFRTTLVQLVIQCCNNNLCYLDFKLANLIATYDDDDDSCRYMLGDVDGLGCIMGQFPVFMQNRIATYPIWRNQNMFGHPIIDLAQTFYSAMLVLHMYEFIRLGEEYETGLFSEFLEHRSEKRLSFAEIHTLDQLMHRNHAYFRYIGKKPHLRRTKPYAAMRMFRERLEHSHIPLQSRKGTDIEKLKHIIIDCVLEISGI